MTSYDGSTITYDAIGNPLSYRGMSFTWDVGRQLASVTNSGTTTTYKYNSSGIRTSNTVGNTTTNYTLAGTQVLKATTGSNYVLYYYDESGSPVAFRARNGSTIASYYYVKDLQGDIVAITDSSGAKVVEYTYDAWGKVLSTTGSLASTIGSTNPYRYRGYWFDTETGLYYLQSRYYDPQTGRFINADELFRTDKGAIGANVFAYCMNNPVNGVDYDGHAFLSILLGAALSGALVGAATSLLAYTLTSQINGEGVTFAGIGKAILYGGINGAIGGIVGVSGLPLLFKVGFSLGVGAAEYCRIEHETSGTDKEKMNAGLQSGIITAISTFGGAYGYVDKRSAAKAMLDTTVSSSKAGLPGSVASIGTNTVNRSLTNRKDRSDFQRIKAERYWKAICDF